MPRLEANKRTAHLALFPEILKVKHIKRFDLRNFETHNAPMPRLGANARSASRETGQRAGKSA